MNNQTNYTMLCDFYELSMANGYFQTPLKDCITYFDVFFRTIPDEGGFAITAGLEQVVNYIQNLTFTDEDIEYLRSKGGFVEEFLDYLKNFKFTGDIWAIPEGTTVFPREPILTVRAPAIQAQFIETYTACVQADRDYHVPATGTMAHSWVQMFPDEYTAFETYCKLYPNNATLLVDTYNVLRSGVPNAIKAIKNVLWPLGIKKCGIRIDSGDLTYLSKEARKMLDEAGLTDCKIVASNSLDEYIIRGLLLEGAKLDSFGVGERLITSKSDPVFGSVYKLAAVEDKDGNIIPKIKVSENVEKITIPHFKKVYRLYDNDTHKAIADVVTVHDEVIDDSQEYELIDPTFTWKRKKVSNFTAKELLRPIFQGGELVYDLPSIDEIRENCAFHVASLWDEVKRFENPQTYYVDLSERLLNIRSDLLERNKK